MNGAFGIQNNSPELAAAMRRAPRALERHMGRAIERSLHEMARDARARAPKGASTLTNSITPEMLSPLEGIVAPHVDYARMVEEKTGPQGMPPEQSILDWIKVKHIQPNDPAMDQEDLAFVIARSIAVRGTEEQPYLEPAFEANKARAERRISAAIDAALAEVAR